MHTGMQNMLVQRVPEEQEVSAQGLYFFYTGVFSAILTFASGYFYTWFGVHGFYSMSVVALIGCSSAFTAGIQPQRAGIGREDQRGLVAQAGLAVAGEKQRSVERTNSAPCARRIAGAMPSEVPTMQPTMILRFKARAASRMRSASVSPPVLSSLMLTA